MQNEHQPSLDIAGAQYTPQSNAAFLSSSALYMSAFDALLGQIENCSPAPTLRTRETRRLCGRYLALCRLRLNQTRAELANSTGLSTDTLLRLETGLASLDQAPDEAWGRLYSALAGTQSDADWIATVVAVAIGEFDANNERVIERVIMELPLDDAGQQPEAQSKEMQDKHGGSDSAYELFRQALLERNDAAWAHICTLYHDLVGKWIERNGAYAHCGTAREDLIQSTFSRFALAIPPDRFANFPSLGALLSYLRACATSLVIDSVRAMHMQTGAPIAPISSREVPPTYIESKTLRLLSEHLQSEAEYVVAYATFVAGLTPRQIAETHSDLFGSVREVYTTKRRVLACLRHRAGVHQQES